MATHSTVTLNQEELRDTDTTTTVVEDMIWFSYQASALDVVDYGRECVKLAQLPSEVKRRKKVRRRRVIIEDAWRNLLYNDMVERLRPELHEWVMGANGEYCDISRNPAKNIWQEVSVLYKVPPLRETPEDPTDAEKYKELTRATKFNVFWAQVEFELYAFNDLILFPSTAMRRGQKVLRHNKVAGDTVTAIFDPELGDTEPFSLVFIDSYTDEQGQDRERYFWWSPIGRAVYDDNPARTRLSPLTLQPIDDAMPVANPYGRMPFTYLHVDPYHETFWNQTVGDDLVDLTLKTGRQQTQTADLFNRTGHKQLVSHGESVRRGEKTLLDPGAHIVVTGSGSTQIVDWTIDFESRQRVIDNDEARAAGTYGINPERLRKTSYQTAEGARLTERPLTERRQKMAEPLADAERDYREDVILVSRVDKLATAEDLPDPDVYMEVVYAPIAYPGDPAKQLEVDEGEIALGITNSVQVMQRRFPGMSREEALERLEKNLKDQAVVSQIKQRYNVAQNPRTQSAADEEDGSKGPIVRDTRGNNGQPVPGSSPGDQTT